LIIAASSKISRILREKGIDAERIQTIALGTDYAPFSAPFDQDYLRKELSLGPDDFLVGILTDLDDPQILQRVIRTAAALGKKKPRIRLILLGKGALQLERGDQARGLDNLIFYLGYQDVFPKALPSLDLMVFPYHIKGFEARIRNALARRIPLIVARREGLPEELVHRKTALLMSPQNPASLTNAILNAYENTELIRQLSEKGYETVFEKYSSESMASKIVGEYERLARRRNISLA
jgi:glycosyltransferase involved in cell wall biosynthesis